MATFNVATVPTARRQEWVRLDAYDADVATLERRLAVIEAQRLALVERVHELEHQCSLLRVENAALHAELLDHIEAADRHDRLQAARFTEPLPLFAVAEA